MAKQTLKSNVSQRISDKKANSFSYGEKESAADSIKMKKSIDKIDSIDKANPYKNYSNVNGDVYSREEDKVKRKEAMDSLISSATRRYEYKGLLKKKK